MDRKIQIFIRKLQKRLGFQKALNIFPIFLSFGFFIAFLHVLFGYFYPFYYANTFSFIYILLSLIISFLYCCLRFPKEMEAAHTGDRIVGHERLLTAIGLRGNDSQISCLQKEDTISHMMNCNLRKSFPYHFSIRHIAICICCCLLFFTFLILPSDAKLRASKLHDIKQQAKKERILLEKVQDELQNEKELQTPEEKTAPQTIGKTLDTYGKFDTVNDLLEKAKTEYASVHSETELERAKVSLYSQLLDLEAKANANSYEERKAISSLIDKLGYQTEYTDSKKTSSASDSSSQNTQPSNGSSDSQQTENTGNTTSNSNEDTNQNTTTNNNENSNQNNGNAVITNNTSSNQETSNTAENLNSTNENPKKQSENKQNTNNNQNNGNSKKNNNENDNNNPANNGSGNENGNESGKGNGNSNGSGKGNGNGTGSGGGKNYGSKQGIQRKSKSSPAKEQITIMEDTIGNDENLTGNANKNGDSQTVSSNDTLRAGTKKDFDDVVSDYAHSAYTAIENNKVPSSMTYIVRNYFSKLNSDSF